MFDQIFGYVLVFLGIVVAIILGAVSYIGRGTFDKDEEEKDSVKDIIRDNKNGVDLSLPKLEPEKKIEPVSMDKNRYFGDPQ